MAFNRGRIWLGGVVGGIVWLGWSFFVGRYVITDARYTAAQNAGLFLKTPRYPFFVGEWIALLFVLAIAVAHLYAWARAGLAQAPEPPSKSASSQDSSPASPETSRRPPFSGKSCASLWLDGRDVPGAILAALVAGALYKE